jgi:glycosyltransferase involved in cell wall biosynthesis
MKVCQLCAVDFTLKNFLVPLIDSMEENGWVVIAVCSDGPAVRGLRDSGYQIETIPIRRSTNPFFAIQALLALIRLFRKERFDVLHAHTPVAALIGRIAGFITRIPLVIYTAHGFYFHEDMPAWKYKIYLWIERIGGRFTDILFSQSAEDTQEAIAKKIVHDNQTLTIGNGVDITRFDPNIDGQQYDIRKELGIPQSAYVVGFVGRMVREKGLVELLDSAQMVAATHKDVWFFLIGEQLDSDHSQGVTEELSRARLLLGDRLVTSPLRNDIPQCLIAMDLFCLPSWREGMPRTIIEAMMMGKPVVATNIRGCREEVIHNETGLLVPPRAPKLLTSAITSLVDNRALGLALGIAGRKRALAMYDERKVIQLQLERIVCEAKKRGIL